MKRVGVNFIMGLTLLFLTACNSSNAVISVKDGTYILEQTEAKAVTVPHVSISNGNISFIYDYLSSYLPYGTYKVEGNILTMATTDGKYRYIFEIKEDKLIFQKDESSDVNLTDDRLGIKIIENAEFKLKQ